MAEAAVAWWEESQITMAEAALAWWEESQAREDRIASIGDQIQLLLKTTHDKDFLAGLSEAEGAAKLTEAKEKRQRLLKMYRQLRLEPPVMPDFSGMTESERAAAAEGLRKKQLERARLHPNGEKLEVLARLVDFDPKQEGCVYYNRYTLFCDPTFDLDEESPFGPRRFCTDDGSKEHYSLSGAVNILSVNIASSDVGFPIHVYGTVIVRDSMDERCVYHFRRDGDHCQLIKSEAESLILTGPKRGLALLDDICVEIDLKIKDHPRQDIELSKGLVIIRGLAARSFTGTMVETKSLSTRLSTVDMTYSVVKDAVEGTISVQVLRGGFHGKIIAHIIGCKPCSLVLYDSKDTDASTVDCGKIQLTRPILSVNVMDLLHIVAWTSDGQSRKISFTPKVNKGDRATWSIGATRMGVKVFWSAMNA